MSLSADPVLTIEPLGWCVRVAPGQSLWEAARAGGVRLRSSCRNGTCRACWGELRSGQVVYRVEWPGISTEEQAAGGVLPCVALPVGDVVLVAQEHQA